MWRGRPARELPAESKLCNRGPHAAVLVAELATGEKHAGEGARATYQLPCLLRHDLQLQLLRPPQYGQRATHAHAHIGQHPVQIVDARDRLPFQRHNDTVSEQLTPTRTSVSTRCRSST